MGKTKQYFDPESTNTQHEFCGRETQRTTTTTQEPTIVTVSYDSVHTFKAVSIAAIKHKAVPAKRWKRPMVALQYQLGRFIPQDVSLKLVGQVAIVAIACCYVLFDSDTGISPVQLSLTDQSGIKSEANAKAKPAAQKNNWTSKNEASPVADNELYATQVKDYIGRFEKIARTEMSVFGIPASISLAQGLVESRAGLSKLAVNNNNHFGIKCFSRKCRKGHCSNFTDDTHKDFFRKFQNPWESWREHSRLLSQGRYKKLQQYGSDYKKWAYGLKSVGYATDRTYAEKLIGIIERYDLYRYDR